MNQLVSEVLGKRFLKLCTLGFRYGQLKTSLLNCVGCEDSMGGSKSCVGRVDRVGL